MKRIYLLIFIFALNIIPGVYAEFNDIGCGARPLAMGNAFVALADDINAIYYNPAGLVRLEKNEFTSSYGRLYVGLDDDSNLGWGFAGYAQPVGNVGTMGIGYQNFSLLNHYAENTFIFSWGKWITGRMSGGLSVKLLKQKIFQDPYTEIDPVFEYGEKDTVSGIGIDIGSFYKLSKKISGGITMYNINRPDMGFMEKSQLPLAIKTGVAYKDEKLASSIDFSYEEGAVKVFSGGEAWFLDRVLALRGGLGLGSNEYRNFTIGLGCQFNSVQFDYAFLFPVFGINNIYGSHRISITMRFGSWPRSLNPPDELEPREAKIKALEDKVEKLLLKNTKEKESYTRELDYIKQKHVKEIKTFKQKIQTNGKVKIKEITAEKKKKEKDKKPEKKKKQKREISQKKKTVPAKKKKVVSEVKKKKTVTAVKKKVAPVAKKKTVPAAKKKSVMKTKVPAKAATKPTPVKVKKEAAGGKKAHKVGKGETLKDIALKYYGDANKWKVIYSANADKIQRGKPKTGSTLIIP
jgi:hypothetical protein